MQTNPRTQAFNEGMQGTDMDRVRGSAKILAELFRQISLQLNQDRHALLELAEDAKSADRVKIRACQH